MCETCGLPLPEVPTRGRRLFCTRICRLNKNRYPRAVTAITEIVEAATRSEDLDRSDLAAQEWKALDVALRRLEAMNERIREERTEAGLSVPPDWLGAIPADQVIHLD
jgi:hypothetical protein